MRHPRMCERDSLPVREAYSPKQGCSCRRLPARCSAWRSWCSYCVSNIKRCASNHSGEVPANEPFSDHVRSAALPLDSTLLFALSPWLSAIPHCPCDGDRWCQARRFGHGSGLRARPSGDTVRASGHAGLFDTPFSSIEGASVYVRRQISADDIVGLAFSLSTSSPERLGDHADAFERELRGVLAELSPSGLFIEVAELAAVVARRGRQ